jgi:hypothetical protein
MVNFDLRPFTIGVKLPAIFKGLFREALIGGERIPAVFSGTELG